MQDPINNYLKVDMATATKSIKDFSGTEQEDVISWIRDCKLVAKVGGLTVEELTRIMILALRGNALS